MLLKAREESEPPLYGTVLKTSLKDADYLNLGQNSEKVKN